MSYTFHNKAPGAKKQAKRLRQYEEEMLGKKAGSNLNMVQAQARTQEATGKAYLMLSGQNAGADGAYNFGDDDDDSFKNSLSKKRKKRKAAA